MYFINKKIITMSIVRLALFINMTGTTIGSGTAYPFRASE